MHLAQPKEGHKIWLTQEADAKSWSSLKHVQPKEGRKELAPREIKFRYRRLETTIRERAGSSQVPREAQESERYPGLLFFVSFFSSFLIRDVVAKSLRAMEETREQTGVSHGAKQRQREREAAPQSAKAFCGLWATVNACACWWGMPSEASACLDT